MKQPRLLIIGALAILSVEVAAAQVKNAKTPGAGWSGATLISPALQPDPTRGSQSNDVAVSAAGLAIAAWDQFAYTSGAPYSIGAAVQSGGKWGAPFVISANSTGYALCPKVAAGADGTLAVAWLYQDVTLQTEKVQVAVRPAGTTWNVTTLATRPTWGAAQPAPVVVDARGNVTVVWTAFDGTSTAVQAATMQGGIWSQPLNVSTTAGAQYPSVAVNANGDTGIVYSVWGSNLSTHAEYVFRKGPDGGWSTAEQVSEPMSASTGYVQNPRVALDAQGLATVAYTSTGVKANRQLASRSWGGPQTVVLQLYGVPAYFGPDLAVDGSGNAVLAVSVFDSAINVDRASVWSSFGTPEGRWTTQQRITDPATPVDAYATRVAVSPDGQLAMIGWIDHYHGTVQVRRLVGGVLKAAETVGRGTAWASFQEALGLNAATGTFGCATWKSTKNGTQIMAATYR